MLRIPTLAALMLAATALTACDDDDSPTALEGFARVRVVQASPNAPNLDVLVDGEPELTSIAFRSVSQYLEVEPGSANVRVRATGATTNVIDFNTTLDDDADYTVIVAGLLANIEALVLSDDNSAPPAGSVRVRFVHAAPSAGNVDIYVTAPGVSIATLPPSLSNVAFKVSSPYTGVPTGTYQVRVTATGSKTPIIDTGPVTLTAGQVRTGIALDGPGGGAPFGALILEDRS
ncbi:MAG: DUF4397 domain-containing protein [Gemmatimonadaceae bacterium]